MCKITNNFCNLTKGNHTYLLSEYDSQQSMFRLKDCYILAISITNKRSTSE